MGRDKSRAHLHSLHRIDSNTAQQLEVLRQKLAQVGTENKCTNAMRITMPIVGHAGSNDHLLRCVCLEGRRAAILQGGRRVIFR